MDLQVSEGVSLEGQVQEWEVRGRHFAYLSNCPLVVAEVNRRRKQQLTK
jgi:hypothetical protein